MTVENLSLPPTAEGEARAAEIIKKGMASDHHLLNIIRHHLAIIRTHPLQTPKSIYQDIIDSVYTSSQTILQTGGKDKIVLFHVYMSTISTDLYVLDSWIGCLKAGEYSLLEGTAVPCESYICTYCMGHDHPTGLCPLATLAYI